MRVFRFEALFTGSLAFLMGLGISGFRPEPVIPTQVSADEFVRALSTHRQSLVDLYFAEHLNPNARAAQDRPLLLAAILEQDWSTAHRLIEAGACPDLADETGLTPLMAAAMQGNLQMIYELIPRVTRVGAVDRSGRNALHYAVAAKQEAAMDMLLPQLPGPGQPCADGRDLLSIALDTGNKAITDKILNLLPPQPQWTVGTQRALAAALRAEDKDQVRLLMRKHNAPPVAEGRGTPLLAYAIASRDAKLFTTLLSCGADPNTVLPPHPDKDFLGMIQGRGLRSYLEDDKGVTVLMVAAGLDQVEYLQALIDAGADRNRATSKCHMLALYLAAETGQWRSTQILLGSGPAPEQLRVEISLASQRMSLIKDGVPVFDSICSTGRAGYSTHAGDYVVTDKERSHRSTIYKVEMPYFMRLSCRDFGMHEGVVPNYPASHGCIRLPGETARRLFSEIPIGTLVSVK